MEGDKAVIDASKWEVWVVCTGLSHKSNSKSRNCKKVTENKQVKADSSKSVQGKKL